MSLGVKNEIKIGPYEKYDFVMKISFERAKTMKAYQ